MLSVNLEVCDLICSIYNLNELFYLVIYLYFDIYDYTFYTSWLILAYFSFKLFSTSTNLLYFSWIFFYLSFICLIFSYNYYLFIMFSWALFYLLVLISSYFRLTVVMRCCLSSYKCFTIIYSSLDFP